MRNHAYFRREFSRRGPVLSLFVLFTATAASADPAVLLETARLNPADGAPQGGYGRSVAIDGNVAVVGATVQRVAGSGTDRPGAAYVFERNAQGVWQQTAKLVGTNPPDAFGFDVAVDGNVIAIGDPDRERVHVFEKQGASWVRTAVLGTSPPPPYFTGNGFSVAVHGDLIAVSHRDDNGLALYRRSTAGWQQVAAFSDGFAEEDATYMGPHVDVTNGIAVFGTPSLFEHGPAPGHINLYSPGANGDWANPTLTSWEHPDINGDFNGPVAISGNTLLAAGWIYERNASGTWVLTNTSTQADALDDDESTVIAGAAPNQLDQVFQRDAAGLWTRVAELAPSIQTELERVALNSKRVVAASPPSDDPGGQAFVFELPTTLDRPSLLQDDFQDGNAQGWSPLGGSFSVTSANATYVYRQTNTTGNAAALLANASYPDQSIQADIIPRAFDGADRWFGLVARYVNSGNYYYATVRSGGGVQLKKMIGGSFTTLGTAPLAVTLNRTHRLRLEAVGDHVRVLVNNLPVISVRDDDISGGQPGVMMYRTRADYDNVVVNANPGVPVIVDDFSQQQRRTMSSISGNWGHVYWGLWLQQDLTGNATLLTNNWPGMGVYGDQIVEADLKPTQFSGPDRWIGLAARYVDANNYLYVTLRSSNTLQIKKLVNGAIQTLGSTAFPVATNTTYRVRLEAVGSRVRVYVNGEQRLEASDVSNAPGAKQAGVLMYKTAAEVDNFLWFQP